eukprot:scaffold2682_cov344-Pavlova_lutheri.AAC.8
MCSRFCVFPNGHQLLVVLHVSQDPRIKPAGQHEAGEIFLGKPTRTVQFFKSLQREAEVFLAFEPVEGQEQVLRPHAKLGHLGSLGLGQLCQRIFAGHELGRYVHRRIQHIGLHVCDRFEGALEHTCRVFAVDEDSVGRPGGLFLDPIDGCTIHTMGCGLGFGQQQVWEVAVEQDLCLGPHPEERDHHRDLVHEDDVRLVSFLPRVPGDGPGHHHALPVGAPGVHPSHDVPGHPFPCHAHFQRAIHRLQEAVLRIVSTGVHDHAMASGLQLLGRIHHQSFCTSQSQVWMAERHVHPLRHRFSTAKRMKKWFRHVPLRRRFRPPSTLSPSSLLLAPRAIGENLLSPPLLSSSLPSSPLPSSPLLSSPALSSPILSSPLLSSPLLSRPEGWGESSLLSPPLLSREILDAHHRHMFGSRAAWRVAALGAERVGRSQSSRSERTCVRGGSGRGTVGTHRTPTPNLRSRTVGRCVELHGQVANDGRRTSAPVFRHRHRNGNTWDHGGSGPKRDAPVAFPFLSVDSEDVEHEKERILKVQEKVAKDPPRSSTWPVERIEGSPPAHPSHARGRSRWNPRGSPLQGPLSRQKTRKGRDVGVGVEEGETDPSEPKLGCARDGTCGLVDPACAILRSRLVCARLNALHTHVWKVMCTCPHPLLRRLSGSDPPSHVDRTFLLDPRPPPPRIRPGTPGSDARWGTVPVEDRGRTDPPPPTLSDPSEEEGPNRGSLPPFSPRDPTRILSGSPSFPFRLPFEPGIHWNPSRVRKGNESLLSNPTRLKSIHLLHSTPQTAGSSQTHPCPMN